ncbi:MAG: VWA domain-containing protein [Steroidobacteraceae bacterium]
MLIPFFFKLREGGVPVSLTEFLLLLESLDAQLAESSAEKFYYLSRACLVKDERHYDRFDRVFAAYFKGLEDVFNMLVARLPEEWLKRLSERIMSEEEKAQVEALGGWDKLMQTLKERLKEQKERHEGGNKWIGTNGTSPFGAYGYNPEGMRIGQNETRNKRAVKVWDRRDFRNLDDTIELGTRNIKVALRKLRKFAREGAADQLDLDDTISSTARNAGLLDLKFVPERHNAIKVLLFLDVGGSMEPHVRVCEELFSAARSEFKHLKYYYFHNFIYEGVWQDNRRRHQERIATQEVLRTYGHDYKLIFVGDAAMSPYEIVQPGGSVEHWNEEAGSVWMQRLVKTWPHHVWLNPEPESRWNYTQSINVVRELVENRMFPLTLQGLDKAIKALH